jgi:hypothetical protein
MEPTLHTHGSLVGKRSIYTCIIISIFIENNQLILNKIALLSIVIIRPNKSYRIGVDLGTLLVGKLELGLELASVM